MRFSLLLLVLLSCAPAAVVTPEAPKPVTVAPPAPGPRAPVRWLIDPRLDFYSPSLQTELSGIGMLQAGYDGKRWLFRADGSIETAKTLAGSRLLGLLRDEERYVFVGHHGDTWIANSPLGAFVESRPGPTFDPESKAAVGNGILVVDAAGRLSRSIDKGRTFRPVALNLSPVSRAVGVAPHRDGDLFALFHPQRVMRSSDGGATWSRVASGGMGAAAIDNDAAGDVWLVGIAKSALRFDRPKEAFELGGKPVPARSVPKDGMGILDKTPRRTLLLAGDRMVTLTEDEAGSVTISGLEPGAVARPLPAFPEGSGLSVRGDGEGVLFIVTSYKPPSTRVLRTTDGTALTTVLDTPDYLAVAEDGTMVSQAQCKRKACGPIRLRVGSAWKDLAIPSDELLSSVVADTSQKRVLIFSDTPKSNTVTSVRVDGSDLRVLTTSLPSGGVAARHVTQSGELMTFLGTPGDLSDTPTIVETLSAKGEKLPRRHVPLLTHFAFAGPRGLAYGGESTWETNDDGLHWTRVPAPHGFIVRECSAAGCVDSGTARLGWELDLGAVPKDAMALVAGDPPKAAPPTPVTRKLRCTPTGAWSKHPQALGDVSAALDGGVRFALATRSKTDALTALIARDNKLQTLALLPPWKAPKGRAHFDGHSIVDGGITAARVSFDATEWTQGNPIPAERMDVHVAWWSARTGKVHHADAKGLKRPEHFNTYSSFMREIVEGGIVVQLDDVSGLFFASNDGKVQLFGQPTMPGNLFHPSSAVRLGDRFLFKDRYGYDDVITETLDFGKTFRTKVWTMGSLARLGAIDNRPVLLGLAPSPIAYGPIVGPTYIQPLDPFGDDPPDGLTVPSLAALNDPLAACAEIKGGIRLPSADPTRVLEVAYLDDPKSAPIVLRGSDRVLRVGSTAACTESLGAQHTGDDTKTRVLVTPRDLAHAWVLRGSGAEEISVRGATCSPEP